MSESSLPVSRRAVLFVLIMLLTINAFNITPQPVHATPSYPMVTPVSGTVEFRRFGADLWETMHPGEPVTLYLGDEVRTGAGAQAIITTDNGATLLKENTQGQVKVYHSSLKEWVFWVITGVFIAVGIILVPATVTWVTVISMAGLLWGLYRWISGMPQLGELSTNDRVQAFGGTVTVNNTIGQQWNLTGYFSPRYAIGQEVTIYSNGELSEPTNVSISGSEATELYNFYYGAFPSVGGVVVPVDKFGLLEPYIGLASTVAIAAVVSVIYVKQVKRRTENR